MDASVAPLFLALRGWSSEGLPPYEPGPAGGFVPGVSLMCPEITTPPPPINKAE